MSTETNNKKDRDCFSNYTPGQKLRYLERDIASLKSDCPGFKKHYDPHTAECQYCKRYHFREWQVCRYVCLQTKEGEFDASDPRLKTTRIDALQMAMELFRDSKNESHVIRKITEEYRKIGKPDYYIRYRLKWIIPEARMRIREQERSDNV